MKREDNRGLTLVELIIVIAIIAVLTGIVMMSVSIISGLPAKKCANNIYSALSRVRVTTMGKNMDTLQLEVRPDGIFAVETIDSVVETKQLGKNTVKLYVTVNSGGTETETEITSGGSILIDFNRSTGALKPITVGSTDYYTKIRAKKGGKSYTVSIVPFTGKMSVSKDAVTGP